ncbi:hypothetical protein LL253_01895 [Sphingobium soli]|uniref:Uncharacterized protein n=1 Tax=Sphingobium soli TaxID=1591116 RepID=A0ABS8GZ01_9SPHN|nr:hypothetical protein [Sphingobium soli]MCC4231439.1 hypothetical protein [Sphingobium soli]
MAEKLWSDTLFLLERFWLALPLGALLNWRGASANDQFLPFSCSTQRPDCGRWMCCYYTPMNKPRFRRWLGYNYLPLNLTAWLTIAALLLIEAPLMALSFHVVPETLEWWGLAILSFGLFLSGWAFIHWHSE